MFLLIYLIGLYVVFRLVQPPSPVRLLLLIYIGTLILAVYIGGDFVIDSWLKMFNFLFLVVTLSLFICPWGGVRYDLNVNWGPERRLWKIATLLLCINAFAFSVFLIACIYAFSRVTNYEEFKNNGASWDYLDQLPINHYVSVAAIYMHPTAYFLIPIHLYYAQKRRFTLSVIAFILSLNVILFGLTVFSRSGFIEYGFLYAFNWSFFSRKISMKVRRSVKSVVLVATGAIAFVFYGITENRFGQHTGGKGEENPIVNSLIDYASQWYRNGNEVMGLYSSNTLNGQLSFPLVFILADRAKIVEYPADRLDAQIQVLFGDYYYKFNGLIPNLLFDFGYIGTSIFGLVYVIVVLAICPRRGEIPVQHMLILGTLFIIPAWGVFGSQLRSPIYNMVIIYSIGLLFLFRKKHKML